MPFLVIKLKIVFLMTHHGLTLVVANMKLFSVWYVACPVCRVGIVLIKFDKWLKTVFPNVQFIHLYAHVNTADTDISIVAWSN